jgi:excisionase family DNA binding protein
MDQLELPLDAVTVPFVGAEYLTIAESARRVRCCERTIRRAIDAGDLRAGRIRGRGGSRGGYRIRPRDLDEWLFRDAS